MHQILEKIVTWGRDGGRTEANGKGSIETETCTERRDTTESMILTRGGRVALSLCIVIMSLSPNGFEVGMRLRFAGCEALLVIVSK
jgi:hypothetical protein